MVSNTSHGLPGKILELREIKNGYESILSNYEKGPYATNQDYSRPIQDIFARFLYLIGASKDPTGELSHLNQRVFSLLTTTPISTPPALKAELMALRKVLIRTKSLQHQERPIEILLQHLNRLTALKNIPRSTIPDIETLPYNNNEEALIFSTQQFCIHDGPGIRTVIFFKGCELDCQWCQNPEGKSKEIELEFNPDRCLSHETAQQCVDVCDTKAISIDANGKLQLDRSKCDLCGDCTNISEAFRPAGQYKSVQSLFEELQKDKAYFDRTGGGVTISGGEPLLQWKAARQLLEFCRSENIHTVIETAGIAPLIAFQSVRPLVDQFYFDLKGTGPSLKKIVGKDSHRGIQRAAKYLVNDGAKVAFRMLIVPKFNDSDESLKGIAEFLHSLKISEITLLKYGPGGEHKIERVDASQPHLNITEEQSTDAILSATKFFQREGLSVLRNDGENEPPHPQLRITKRVARLRDTVRQATYSVCTERDLLLTEYYRKNQGSRKSAMRLHAGAFEHIFRNKSTAIYPDELLVGNYTSKRVGGHLYAEYHGSLGLAPVFAFINRRKVNPTYASAREIWNFYIEILPFWASRNVLLKSFPDVRSALSFAIGQLKSNPYATPLVAGVSHFIPNYEKLLALGTTGLIAEIQRYKATADDTELYDSAEMVLKGLEAMAENFANCAQKMADKIEDKDDKRKKELLEIAAVCKQVPMRPAKTFQEALQMILFGQIGLVCETSQHGVGIGRIDQLLNPYYQKDLRAGRITQEKARELLHCFSIKVSEYSSVMPPVGGKLYSGLNNGQAADFGGCKPTGEDATNDISYLCAEACGLGMKGPNYHARIHKNSPKEFVELVSRVLCSGSPLPAVFNEDVIVPTLQNAHPHISVEEIRNFGIVGCCEICPPSSFPDTDNALVNIVDPFEETLELKPQRQLTIPFPLLSVLIKSNTMEYVINGLLHPLQSDSTIHVSYKGPFATLSAFKKSRFNPQNIEEVITHYSTHLDKLVEKVVTDVQHLEKGLRHFPTLLSTALIDGTFEKGKEVNAGGAKYNSSGIQGVGLADVIDSLYAINEMVFTKRECSWEELINALRTNFQGQERLREHLLKLPKYGNDNPEVDRFADRVMELFSRSLSRFTNTRGGPYLAGWYAMTTHTHFGKSVGALPSGRRPGLPLANGLSPCLGTERLGPTAALNSSATPNLISTAGNGVIVNLKLHQLLLKGQRGIETLSGLIQGYFDKGGMQVQFNILDPQVLIDALAHPENHQDLIVRISGYAAYFNDLSPEMKQAIIKRTLHGAEAQSLE